MLTSQVSNGDKISQIEETKISPTMEQVQYRLYKRRFSGLLGMIILGIVTGMPWSWFGPIANNTADDFHISLTQVNWLGNILSCIFLPTSIFIPVICSRYGIRRCVDVGGAMLLISAWVRYAGIASSLSPPSAYVLLILGQFISGLAQPVFQVLGPMYSERWFDLNGRTTATMLIAIANPIGSALGQLLSPLVGTTRQSILVLGIISTAAVPAILLIADSPPSPPTYSGSKPPPPLSYLCRAILGLEVPQEAYMTPRERVDFVIVTLIFGVLVGATNTLSVLSAQWFQPAGYSSTIAGLLGATLLLAGIIAAAISAPLFDRVFTHRIRVAIKIFVPIVSLAWLSLVWAIRPNNLAVIFVIMVIIGTCSMTLLPIALELGVELTRNADGSASILWCSCCLCIAPCFTAEGALRAPSTANPPYNMHDALILHGCVVMVFGALVFFLRAKQIRREMDEAMMKNNAFLGNTTTGTAGTAEGGSAEHRHEELATDKDGWSTDGVNRI
ncbi:major facilitator superfamily domain-containing protein [Scleroderma citrinum]